MRVTYAGTAILKSVLVGYLGPKGYPKAHATKPEAASIRPVGLPTSLCYDKLRYSNDADTTECNVVGLTGTKGYNIIEELTGQWFGY